MRKRSASSAIGANMDLHAQYPEAPIQTDRLSLRLLEPQDAGWIAVEIANPAVQKWLTSPPHPYRLSDAEDFIAKFGAQSGIRVIDLNGLPLGVVSIEPGQNLDPERPALAELGYWLQQSAWGHGYMTEAAKALTEWHFVHIGGPVYSGWIKGNAASENILRKLGFSDLETVDRRSEFHDTLVPVERVILRKPRDAGLSVANRN